jgi:hypothetical protein
MTGEERRTAVTTILDHVEATGGDGLLVKMHDVEVRVRRARPNLRGTAGAPDCAPRCVTAGAGRRLPARTADTPNPIPRHATLRA